METATLRNPCIRYTFFKHEEEEFPCLLAVAAQSVLSHLQQMQLHLTSLQPSKREASRLSQPCDLFRVHRERCILPVFAPAEASEITGGEG